MITASGIVHQLLESDGEDDIAAKDALLAFAAERDARHAAGDITPETAMTASRFYHRKEKYGGRRSNEPIEVRRMGRTKTWKTRPGEFRIPVKYGLRTSFYIDHTNAHEWSTVPPQ